MKSALVVLLALSVTVGGCTSVRVMTPGSPATSSKSALHAGDRARVLLKSGGVRQLRISAVDAQTLTGTEGKGTNATTVQIAMTDVQSVEYRRTSGLRTTGLVLLLAAAVVAATPEGRYLYQCAVNENCGD